MPSPARALAAALVLALVLAGGCERYETNEAQAPSRSLEAILDSGELVVLTRNAPTTRYVGRHGEPTGPEHDLATAFADALGVEVRFEERRSVSAVLDALERAEGDLAAAGLTITEPRRDRFRFGPPYQPVTQQVVCRRDRVQPESVEALVGLDLRVISDSSYVERLQELRGEAHPELEWTEVEDATTEQLLRGVWRRRFDCTVADSTIVDINRRYLPELSAPMNLSREQQLGWAMPQPREDLEEAVGEWLEVFREDGRLAALREEYYGFFAEFDYVDIRTYIRRIDERFPKFRGWFREAAREHDLPFTLIAAQGYQESHWRPDARSPTGVLGIMMLTRRTAEAVGVKDRTDPRQSIFGGARYLKRMRGRFDEAVREPDRTWLALAAYNVGRAHLHDAQRLARERDLSPHLWRNLKQVLPLLADPDVYHDLEYGYARGREPVRYVQRIREYRHVLENQLD